MWGGFQALPGHSRRLQGLQGPPGPSRGLQGPPGSLEGLPEPPKLSMNVVFNEAEISCGWSGWTRPPGGGGGLARLRRGSERPETGCLGELGVYKGILGSMYPIMRYLGFGQ